MYSKEIDTRSRRSYKRRRRRRRMGGILLVAALLTVGGGLLAFRLKGAEVEAPGTASTVSAMLSNLPTHEDSGEEPEILDEPVVPEDLDTVPDSAQEPEPAQEPDATSQPVQAEEPETPVELPPEPDGDDDWHLLLVNPWNFIPEGYEVTLRSLGGGHSVDERCYDDLQAMLAACEAEEFSPVICSSYRTQEKQETLFENKIQRLIKQGYSPEEAPAEAAKVVAVPGTSEHQLGLALDIVDASYQVLDKRQEETPVQQWLMEHSWEYGFILRYPNEKSDITGIIYEPWHYRYVGREAAEEIYTQGVCLEEYLGRVHEE